MKKSKIILGGLAVMTSTLLAACGASSSKTAANQKLNWIEEAELSTIDVSKIMDDVSFNKSWRASTPWASKPWASTSWSSA